MEGNPKIQAEKPLNEEAKNRHLKEIRKEIRDFMKQKKDIKNKYVKRAVERAKNILQS